MSTKKGRESGLYAYGYTRVSTPRQGESRASLDRQDENIRAYYERVLKPRGYLWGGVFEDAAVTSQIPMLRRQQGYRLLVKLRKGDAVIAAVFDRAFRSVKDWCVTDEAFKNLQVELHLVNCGGIDSSTPEGRLHLNMMASFAQFEREMISKRIREAFVVVRQRCKGCKHSCNEHDVETGLCNHGQCRCAGFRTVQLGTPAPRIGVKWGEGPRGKRKKVWDVEIRHIMAKIVEWRDEGYTFEEIYWHMFRSKIKNSKGRLWGRTAIQLAYRREKEYQREAEATGTTTAVWSSKPLGAPVKSRSEVSATNSANHNPCTSSSNGSSVEQPVMPLTGCAASSVGEIADGSISNGRIPPDRGGESMESSKDPIAVTEPGRDKSTATSGSAFSPPDKPVKRKGMWSVIYDVIRGI